MDLLNHLKHNAQKITELGEKYGALNLRVFGSIARGDFDETSDVDFLYLKAKNSSPWFPGGLKMDLEELLEARVDLVSDKFIKEKFKDRILREAIPLCELTKQG